MASLEFTETPRKVVFHNNSGTFNIYKDSITDPVTKKVVGPGYIGRFRLPNGNCIIDDLAVPAPRDEGLTGGFGGFNFVYAEKNESFPSMPGEFIWPITSRHSVDRDGYGVSSSKIFYGPIIKDGIGRLGTRVELSNPNKQPVFSVSYDYRFHPYAVAVVITIQQLIDPEDSEFPIFIKQPSVMAGLAPELDYRVARCYSRKGSFNGQLPIQAMFKNQSHTHVLKNHIQFTSSFTLKKDLHLIGMGFDGENPHLWGNKKVGFTAWMEDANNRPILMSDSPNCLKGHNYGKDLGDSWKFVTDEDSKRTAVRLSAWDGGLGQYDCFNTFREIGKKGDQYQVFLALAYGDYNKVGDYPYRYPQYAKTFCQL